jgi:hypothetical protein
MVVIQQPSQEDLAMAGSASPTEESKPLVQGIIVASEEVTIMASREKHDIFNVVALVCCRE